MNRDNIRWQTMYEIVQKSLAGREMEDILLDSEFNDKTRPILKGLFDQLGDHIVAYKAVKLVQQKVYGCDESDTRVNTPSYHDQLLMKQVSLSIAKSVRMAGRPTPTLCDQDAESSVQITDTGFRIFQRAICCSVFSHGKKRFMDSVIVEGGTGPGIPHTSVLYTAPQAHAQVSDEHSHPPKTSVWFAQLVAVFRLSAPSGPLVDGNENEFALIRYYEVVDRKELDTIDVATGCIKLRWARDIDTDTAEP